ncbi:16S rRNA processing protein RimM [Acidisarcina polymorpha]|uniref:Ribosome maturation factor RimM n=1 Tax=Acidisarcina polymorpha TaxID=2211140 RepID=A0A2Z5G6Z1_9BACT|nr:ribosome maturation factor RimM [Acidisarcina polymorpha]AXC14326.1 16S rRNA processing protein RimM [Acidisarcina polymorpha]
MAKIVRPQGRHGEVLADLLTDFPERFSERKRLFLLPPKGEPRAVELENHWLHQGRIVLKLIGIESINDAETLRGLDVAIPKHERAPLEDGAVYISDLLNCKLVDSLSDLVVGKIANVDRESGPTSLLVVETPAGGEVLVPFVKAYRPIVDVAAKSVSMELPEGLLDLNAPSVKKQPEGEPPESAE